MRIAFITYEYPPFIMGGAGVYAKNITEELAKLGHYITVFTPAFKGINDEDSIDNLEIVRIKINKKLPFKALHFWSKLPKEVKKAENKNKFDIVHINGNSYFSYKKQITEAPQIVMIHHSVRDVTKINKIDFITRFFKIGNEDSLIMPIIEKIIVNSARKIVVPSEFTKNRIIYHYKIDPSLIKVIHEGIDFKNISKLNNLKIENFTQKENPFILFVGRIDDPRKGLDLLLKIFKKVLIKSDCELVVIGAGNPENAIYLAKSMGILNKIFFAGRINESSLNTYYKLCDVYVCPSRLEGFGLTILEAMTLGKPVVAFNVGAIPELIKNYYNGILVEKNDIDEFAFAIIYLLNGGKLEWTAEERINYIKENFTWKNSAKKHVKLYATVVP